MIGKALHPYNGRWRKGRRREGGRERKREGRREVGKER